MRTGSELRKAATTYVSSVFLVAVVGTLDRRFYAGIERMRWDSDDQAIA
jgi:hypothetical protein